MNDETSKPVAAPGYWMYEQSGVLGPAVLAYLEGAPMTTAQIGAMRAYLRQWMAGPWLGEDIAYLRSSIDQIIDRPSLKHWLDRADDSFIDPL